MSRARLSSSPCCYRAVLPRVTACCSTSFFSRSLRWTSAAAKPKIPAPKHSTMSSRQVSRHRIASAGKRRRRRGKVDGCAAGSICRHAGSRDAGQQELMGFCRLVG